MTRKTKNKRLAGILLLLIAVAVSLHFVFEPEDGIHVDRGLFAYDDPSKINKVLFISEEKTDTLAFINGSWQINNKFQADRQRVQVLFAILKQVRVRRKVAEAIEDSIARQMEAKGATVAFYEGPQLVKEFKIWGNEDDMITYMGSGNEIYITQIPGYRNFLAGIFLLDENGWREPRVFDFNWSNLQQVERLGDHSFTITYDRGFYQVAGLPASDSSKMVDYLDDLSLLYVNDYLNRQEVRNLDDSLKKTSYSIAVADVGNRKHTLEVMQKMPTSAETLVRVDSISFALVDNAQLQKISMPVSYFKATQ